MGALSNGENPRHVRKAVGQGAPIDPAAHRAVPGTAPGAAPRPAATLHRPLNGLLRWCVPLSWTYAAAEIAHAAVLLWEIRFLDTVASGAAAGPDLQRRAELNDQVVGAASLGLVAIMLAAFVLNGIWIYRAAANARWLDPDPARISPGWAIGWHAVPLANLVMPYRAMRQIWNTSHAPGSPIDAPAGSALSLWWTLWVISSLLGTASFRLSMRGDDIDTMLMADWASVAAAPFVAGAAVLFIRIMRAVTRAQQGRDLSEVFA